MACQQLEVFVDGQRVGVQEDAPLPEAFGDTFVVGDRPWHVPRQRQTLIDEIKLYCAPLDEASIAAQHAASRCSTSRR